MRIHSDEEPYSLVVFPERRNVDMAETLCRIHGGRLPVPVNDYENEVRSFWLLLKEIKIQI